jgi:hypothetical protein
MIDRAYVYTLVAFGKISAANLALLEARVTDLFNTISINQGKDMVSTSMPGSHILFSRQGFSLQDELGAVVEALSIINGQPNTVDHVYPLFF